MIGDELESNHVSNKESINHISTNIQGTKEKT